MGPIDQTGLQLTRRHFFGQSATGIGMAALAGLLGNEARAEGAPATSAHGGLPGLPHFAPKANNHDPALTFIQTGSQIAGRPSIGAWLSYGIGCVTEALPAFVVMISPGSGTGGQPLYDRLWGSGFLPSRYQGVKFRSVGDPVLYLSNPSGFNSVDRRRFLNALDKLNQMNADSFGDPEIA